MERLGGALVQRRRGGAAERVKAGPRVYVPGRSLRKENSTFATAALPSISSTG
jgi:hypothetical protein